MLVSNRQTSRRSYPLHFLFVAIVIVTLTVMFLVFDTSHSTESVISTLLRKQHQTTTDPVEVATKSFHQEPMKKKKIAYAITVTKDGHFVDGALVLGHSDLRVHNSSKGYNSKYDAELVAFVTPTVHYARPVLEAYGWKVLEKRLPVEIDDIENKKYAQNMKDSGCCGADEFLKLWAYTLTEYERIVHLDMDSIVFKNMVCHRIILDMFNFVI